MSRETRLLSGLLPMPHDKSRHLGVSLSYRLYRVLRLVAPERWLTHALLDAAWITRQLAWEYLWATLSPADALRRTRPHLPRLLDRAIPLGASVVDLGGGTGVASRLAAHRASRVLYVDKSSANTQIAQKECEGLTNVTFEVGEALEVLRMRGPFDIALMLHMLGFEKDPEAALGMMRKQARRVVVEVPDFNADPLNAVRLEEGRPCYHDELYLVEFSCDGLQACLEAAGWRVGEISSSHGALFAVADVA